MQIGRPENRPKIRILNIMARLLKVIFASFAAAVGIYILIVLVTLYVGGPSVVEKVLVRYIELWALLLIIVCFPFSYRFLK